MSNEKKDPRTAFCIMSGGMDSTLAMVDAKKKYKDIRILFFDWGHKAVKEEFEAIKKICKNKKIRIHTNKIVRIKVPIHEWDKSVLTKGDPKDAAGENILVPERNLVFISLAASYARANGGGVLIVGFNYDERNYYDTNPKFVENLNTVFKYCNKKADGKIEIDDIVHDKNKIQIKNELNNLGILKLTYSCYAAGGPCNGIRKCKACLKRSKVERL